MNEPTWPSVELFEAIGTMAVEAAGVDVSRRVAVRDIPDPECYLLIKKDGSHEFIRKKDPRRQHTLLSCDDVSKFAAFVAAEGGKPVVWIGPKIVVTDDDDRLRGDNGTYALKTTDLFTRVANLGKTDGFSQAEFLNLLRVDLARAFCNEELRVSLVRTVRAIQKQERSNIGQGTGSYETGLVSQANEAVEWPESLRVLVSVYDDPSCDADRYEIEVILDVRPEDRSKPFKLTPVAADLVTAQQKAMAEIVGRISDELGDTPVFMGSP